MEQLHHKAEVSKLGVAAFVLGLLALLSSLIPFLGVLLVFPLGGTGVGLGIAAVVKEKRAHILSTLGLVFAAASIPISSLISGLVSSLTAPSTEQSTQQSITYAVDGDVSEAQVTDTVSIDGIDSSESETVSLPWSLTITPEGAPGEFEASEIRLSASAGSIFGQSEVFLSCSISVEDELRVKESTSSAQPKVLCLVD